MAFAIIGSAIRKTDQVHFTPSHYWNMVKTAKAFIDNHPTTITHLVSGGAAGADHVAVQIFLDDPSKYQLTLHFPASFAQGKYQGARDANTANYYHRQFSDLVRRDTLGQIMQALCSGAKTTVSHHFKERNTKVAEQATTLMAFTFGQGTTVNTSKPAHPLNAEPAGLKRGGTSDTWNKAIATTECVHVPLWNLGSSPISTFQ